MQAVRCAREAWTVGTRAFSGGNCVTEVLGVPIDDDGGQQVETCYAVMLPLGGSIVDFALAANAQGVFQGVVRLPLI